MSERLLPCAVRSQARTEPMPGTASTVRAFLLFVGSGPWGTDALRDTRLPASIRTNLRRRTRAAGVRPLLIRRHGRSETSRTQVFAAYADPHRPWVESGVLDDPEQLLDLDLDALAGGRSVGLERTEQPVLLTCTHGRHDRCCAERGRPVAATLARTHPAESWEVSHIGGDRFAGNLVVLPDGLYYGRVAPAEAPALADLYRAGHLDLAHLRGRCGYGFAVQAAEWFLRTELGLTRLRAVRLESRTRRGALTDAVFAADGRRWRVRVGRSEGPAQLLTCGAHRPEPIPVHDLIGIEPLAAGP